MTKKLLLAGLPFFVAGVLVATGFHGTKPSIAGDITKGEHVTTSEVPVMPTSFAELADKLSPTVVNVKVTKVEQATFQGPNMHGNPFGDQFGDFFNKFFEQMPQRHHSRPSQGAGSGVIISQDGYILSNNHVVEGAKEVTVTLADSKEYEAEVIGLDPKTDLAVLKIDAKNELTSNFLPSKALCCSSAFKISFRFFWLMTS